MEQWVRTMSAVALWCSTHYLRATCSKDRLALSITCKFADDEIDPFVASLTSELEAHLQSQVHGRKANPSGIDLRLDFAGVVFPVCGNAGDDSAIAIFWNLRLVISSSNACSSFFYFSARSSASFSSRMASTSPLHGGGMRF